MNEYERKAKHMWNNDEGEFVRYDVNFRDWVKKDGTSPFLPEADRYHLYVSLACPWSHRAVILRSLRGLEDVISMSVTDPIWNENGWWFSGAPDTISDTVNGKHDVVDIYRLADPSFDDEETVPILWDKNTGTIVNNESREIIRMFDVEFSEFGKKEVNLFPEESAALIDETITRIYQPINNGVYRSGFSTTQKAYERAVRELFEALDYWDDVLATRRYLCGEELTEADICLFVTLVRFDSVYYSHFKCSIRRLTEYNSLWRYTRDIYQIPGVAETCNFDHIKRHYFGSHTEINPTRIVPVGPELNFLEPHGREALSQ